LNQDMQENYIINEDNKIGFIIKYYRYKINNSKYHILTICYAGAQLKGSKQLT
jgi:hypothetical protein